MARKKNPAAVALGKLRIAKLTKKELFEFTSKGGIARTEAMTKEERRELAKKAIAARWAKRAKKEEK